MPTFKSGSLKKMQKIKEIKIPRDFSCFLQTIIEIFVEFCLISHDMTKCIRFISACQLLSISFIKIHEYDNEKWLAKLTWKCFAPSLFNLCISNTIQLVSLCAFFVGDCMQKMQVQTFKISI